MAINPTPGGGTVAFSQLQAELNFTGNPQTEMSLLYSSSLYTASAYTDLNCLMYHNIAMGAGAGSTAKQAIYDNLIAVSNMSFKNWGSYNKDPNMVVTFTINNNTAAYNIIGDIYIYDGTNDWQFYAFSTNFGGQDTQIDYNTNIQASKPNAKYWIRIDATATYVGISPPGPGVTGNTTTASDSDGVGGGTTRTTAAPSNFDELTPLPLQIIVGGDNIGTGIALNKRTTFTVNFN
jgi:hypothetical protein